MLSRTAESRLPSEIVPTAVVSREWQAPRTDRTTLIDPSWPEVPLAFEHNQTRFATFSGDVLGKNWSQLRDWARAECLAAARRYLDSHGLSGDLPSETAPLITDGHQPQLFHPGVWAKNFGIAALARRVSGAALHLIVDNDTITTNALRVPVGAPDAPKVEVIPFDATLPRQPWEEVRIQDVATFEQFGGRLQAALRSWNIDPLAHTAWPAAVRTAREGRNLVDSLSAARISIEREWGLTNLEVPLSHVSQSASFFWFVAGILVRLPEFWRHHNEVLAEYRRLNRIRSRSHPVADLARQENWFEAPFWVWRAEDQRRGRLFARIDNHEVALRVGDQTIGRFPTTGENIVAGLQELSARGYRLRTRALTTTLFARLCLSDLFIHGLGGAKYDEMTDALIGRFLQLVPPRFMTLSATIFLPLGGVSEVSERDLGALRHQLRDLHQNPERYLSAAQAAESANLIAEKREHVGQLLLGRQSRRLSERYQRRERYLRIHELNAELASHLDEKRQQLFERHDQLTRQLAANQVFHNREFSWILYPGELLRDFYRDTFPV